MAEPTDMRLRTRLFAASSVQLLVFGVLLAYGYMKLQTDVIPMLDDHLANKLGHSTSWLASELEVALGANDPVRIRHVIDRVADDQDFLYVEVRDVHDAVVASRGTRTATAPLQARAPVRFEGMDLGTVELAIDTARVDRVRSWTLVAAIVAAIAWLVSLAWAFVSARRFARPIQAMKEFSRSVAAGELDHTLRVAATGELAELRDHLNAMTLELGAREADRLERQRVAEDLQRELLVVTRKAGMAEIATGVLHNVGNVLNSLNVSLAVAKDQLRQSKVAALAKTVDLYGGHPNGLAGVLASEKGKVLPQYLAAISTELSDENGRLRQELDSAARSVDHIKAIVATQQAYAQGHELREPLDVYSVIDDALRMVEPSLRRHHIELVRDYEPMPRVITDRHKLLQILVNLISNARHALRENGAAPARLTVRLHRSGDRVELAVEDTGVGITSENLARVFEHGFTTRSDGHGFGLHASANAAHELGGSLSVASAGPSQGATFTLNLPFVTQEEPAHELTN